MAAASYATTGLPLPTQPQMRTYIDYGSDPAKHDRTLRISRYYPSAPSPQNDKEEEAEAEDDQQLKTLLKPWADDVSPEAVRKMKFNAMDTDPRTGYAINRISKSGLYMVDRHNWPISPIAAANPNHPSERVVGPGVLGRLGPNHAADTICVLAMRPLDAERKALVATAFGLQGAFTFLKHRLEVDIVVIRRKDTDQLALPGGKVDTGETPIAAAEREFNEEAMGSSEIAPAVKEAFAQARMVYQGPVTDDPRNTRNAWMETTVFCVDGRAPEFASALTLKAGSDASAAEVYTVEVSCTDTAGVPDDAPTDSILLLEPRPRSSCEVNIPEGLFYASHREFVRRGLADLVVSEKLF